METGNWTPNGGRKGQSHHRQRSQITCRFLVPCVLGLSWHLHPGPPASPRRPKPEAARTLKALGQLGMLAQDVTLLIPPIYANAAVRLFARFSPSSLCPLSPKPCPPQPGGGGV